MKNFEKLGLGKDILNVLDEMGFREPTEIQERTIPLALAGKDIIGGSATGSGKTLAFSSGIIENLKPNGKVQALILTPTRELAEQVAKSITHFSRSKNFNALAVYGGVDIHPQIRRISSADIVVGTPGRILDHLNRRTLELNYVKFLVLDEVDRMFDMGFYRDVEKIIQNCPENRQTMLFSATLSADVEHLAKKYTKNAERISVKSYIDHSKLKQVYYNVPANLKFSLLAHLLRKEKSNLVMVFCSTRKNVDFVTGNFRKLGINAKAIHGGMVQSKRLKVLKEFHGKGVNVLVCTDVAARGLDIKNVTHVYNYDIPGDSESYIHRIGRTARAGEEGIAINILAEGDYNNFSNVLKNESIKIEQKDLPKIERVFIQRNKRVFKKKGQTGKFSTGTNNRYRKKRHSFSGRRNKNYGIMAIAR